MTADADHRTQSFPEATRSPGRHRPGLGGSRFAAALFVGLVTVPGVLYAAGVRAPAIDNRDLTAPPSATALLTLEDDALAQLTDHLAEAVPGRGAAVRADAWTDLHLLRRSPNPDVVLGEDGWLFLRDTLDVPCNAADSVDEVAAQITRAAEMVRSTGRRFVTLTPPDKSTIYRDRLGDAAADFPCSLAVSSAVAAGLEQDPPAGYEPLWAEVDSLADSAGDPVYFRQDSHWTSEASITMSDAILEQLAPTLLAEADRVRGAEASFAADLTLLLGLPTTVLERPLGYERGGIDWSIRRGAQLPGVPAEINPIDVNVLEATGGSVVDGRTLFWHDSFANEVAPQLGPFFEQLVMVRKHQLATPWVAELAATSDVLVYETVERELFHRWLEERTVAQLAWALKADLPSTTVEPELSAEGWFDVDRETYDVLALTPEELPSRSRVELEVRDATGEVRRLGHQRTYTADAPRVFDLSGVGDVEQARVVTTDDDPLRPSRVTLIATLAVTPQP